MKNVFFDVAARLVIVWEVFQFQFRELILIWVIGVWLGVSLAWVLKPYLQREENFLNRKLAKASLFWLFTGAVLGLVSPFSLLSLTGLLKLLLKRKGLIPLVIGFTLASPLLSPSILFFTLMVLGQKIVFAKIAVSLITVFLAGLIIWKFKTWQGSGDSLKKVALDIWTKENRSFLGYLHRLALEIIYNGRHFLLALLLAAWIEVFLPADLLTRIWGNSKIFKTVFVTGLAGPLYLCGGGAVVLVNDLLAKGLTAGGALAYLSFGPASTARALLGVGTVLGKKAVWLFLAGSFLVAIAGGVVFDLLF